MTGPVTITLGGFSERSLASLRELETLGYAVEAIVFVRGDDRRRKIMQKDGAVFEYRQFEEDK